MNPTLSPSHLSPALNMEAYDPVLESTLNEVEGQLSSLGDALRARDLASIDLHAGELHRALSSAVDQFSRAARNGPLPASLRRRLVDAGGSVAAQRESLARATAALDRAIDVLLPREAPVMYGNYGGAERLDRSGSVLV